MPLFIQPMLTEHIDDSPLPKNTKADARWGYEPKVDGHRWQIRKDGSKVRIRTRRDKKPQLDETGIAALAQNIHADTAIIDGEVAAIDATGKTTSWEAIQGKDPTLVFFAFDCMYCDGESLLNSPLWQRQEILARIISNTGLQLCVALPGTLGKITRSVKKAGFEGVMAKDRNSPYRPNHRGLEWQAKAFETEQEFVIGGYKPIGSNSLQSLLVGVYEGKRLVFSSQVEPGLNQRNRPELRKLLQSIKVGTCPFANLPTYEGRSRAPKRWVSGGVSRAEMAEFHWTLPRVLAVVRYREWLKSGLLRHPRFRRVRTDKVASEVVREKVKLA